MKMVQF